MTGLRGGLKFSEEPPPRVRPERPLGVTLLTILDGTISGLLPLLSLVGLFRVGTAQSEATPLLFVSILLSAGIVFSAIGAFRGHDGSRLALIILIVLRYSLVIFNQTIPLFAGVLDADMRLSAYGRVLRYVFWIVLNVWYFLRPKTIAYYRRSLQS